MREEGGKMKEEGYREEGGERNEDGEREEGRGMEGRRMV